MEMTDKHIFRLAHAQARALALEIVKTAPEGYIVTIQEPTRTLDQNAALWPVLQEISKQVNWHGNKLTAEEWKDVFSAALKKQKVVPGLDGGFVVCGQRTSRMVKKEFSELIELMYAFGVEHGVKWSDIVHRD